MTCSQVTSDNRASRNESVERIARHIALVTPAIDRLMTAVRDLGGSMTVAIEIEGNLIVRKSGLTRFNVSLRDPDECDDGGPC